MSWRDAVVNWFPGHMAKGVKGIMRQLANVDMVLEVRDARIPLASVNPLLLQIASTFRHVVLLNKADLADVNELTKHQDKLLKFCNGNEPMLLSGTQATSQQLSKIKEIAKEVAKSKIRPMDPKPEVKIMIVGMPNVGKSTLINTFRMLAGGKTKAAKTGALPGVTRSVAGVISLFEEPKTYLIDTPGVMVPNVKDANTGMKLALTGMVKDEVVGIQLIASYLLHILNTYQRHEYVNEFGLDGPTEDIERLLDHVAVKIGALRHQAKRDHLVAAQYLVRAFRAGKCGRFVLDDLTHI